MTTIPTTPPFEVLPQETENSLNQGFICAANEDRFTSTFFSEPLTAFAVGWKDAEDLRSLLEAIAPAVPVGRRFEFKKADNAQVFLSETDDVRAIGSAFKRVDYTGTSINEKTYNKGLTVRVDHDDEVGDDWQERYTQLLIQRLLRNEIRRAISVLDTAATSLAKTWDSSADPDKDLRDALVLAADKSGIYPNRVLFSEGAWNLRMDAYAAQDNARSHASYAMTPEQLAGKLMVDSVTISKARYQTTTTAKGKVVTTNTVYEYYALGGAHKDEPSNIKRFVTPAGGSDFRVYVREHEKFTDITVEHYSNIVITSNLSGDIRKIPVSDS